ncbi:MAG: hypothetical protein M1817_004461 [Caeruleum heppii]|nr:MAG: hypothetical protein M1817_004461 [Caeruleum heppii]
MPPNYHYPPSHPQPYPASPYRPWTGPYPQYPLPPLQQYPNAPLIVSSYPHSHPPPPVPYQQSPLPQPPPPPRPTSSSAHSQSLHSPTDSTPSVNAPTPPLTTSTASIRVATPPPPNRAPFQPPLPWYSVPEETFPSRAAWRRRRRRAPHPLTSALELPASRQNRPTESEDTATTPKTSVAATTSESETPLTSQPPSEVDSTQPTTPSSAFVAPAKGHVPAPSKSAARPVLPAIPLAPVLPHHPQPNGQNPPSVAQSQSQSQSQAQTSKAKENGALLTHSTSTEATAVASDSKGASAAPDPTTEPSSPPVRAAPKSWADLVRSKATKTVPSQHAAAVSGTKQSNGVEVIGSRAGSMAEVLGSFGMDHEDEERKISFLEPRGLVNTGNMCYMNSVLQVLVFCVPFYDFLDKIGKQAAHSFKSTTPLLDAMIMFVREFATIDSASSTQQLRMRLKHNELEQYGESFTPEFVYEVIRRMPRFASMQRGHQQDAEEFLGFLLEGLHEECAQVMRESAMSRSESGISTPTDGVISPGHEGANGTSSAAADGGWLEVGPKQKAAVTRSSGTITTESPITKIFGGKLRSELRVQGLKNSVTLEPYQPLQLDIQSPTISNITDALKGLTRSETLHGDFNSPRGPGATATKQVFIETLPPVLILHLKRFQYDNTGGTQKIWKKVGYPLELEIPKEAFPPHKRGGLAAHGGLPRYRLIGVVYHHGKNASGGHYTVDVRRQDGREWIRLDDTVIRRVKSEEVAEGGSEADGKMVASEQHKHDGKGSGHAVEQAEVERGESAGEGEGWKHVNGGHGAEGGSTKRAWSGVVNGASTATEGKKRTKEVSSIKDNKVAYLLFYEKM